MAQRVLCILPVLIAPLAIAEIQYVESGEGQSWWSKLTEDGRWADGKNPFDLLIFEIQQPYRFEYPTVTINTQGTGWTVWTNDPCYPTRAAISGADWNQNLTWTLNFEGSYKNRTTVVKYACYLDGIWRGAQTLTWYEKNLVSYPHTTWNPGVPDFFIPAPGAAVLGVLGLGLVGRVRRRLS